MGRSGLAGVGLNLGKRGLVTSDRKPPSILRAAHGAAGARGNVLVAESPVLDEIQPLNAVDTGAGIAASTRRGRPFTRDNKAAALKGSSLTRAGGDANAPEEQRRVDRRAAALSAARQRELVVQHGGAKLSTAVRVEVVAWARAVAWSDFYFRTGDAKAGALFAEKASAHGLRAVGLADREAVNGGTGEEQIPGFVNGGGRE